MLKDTPAFFDPFEVLEPEGLDIVLVELELEVVLSVRVAMLIPVSLGHCSLVGTLLLLEKVMSAHFWSL